MNMEHTHDHAILVTGGAGSIGGIGRDLAEFLLTLRPRERSRTSMAKGALKALGVVATSATLATSAFAQSAKEVRGATPYLAIENEPAPKLVVDPPLPNLLGQGVVWIQYRVENVHIVPVFGAGALNVSPRVGHLHIHFDDQPWLWADASDLNTIDLAGVPPGQHKLMIELVNANHQVFPGCATCTQTVTFAIPRSATQAH